MGNCMQPEQRFIRCPKCNIVINSRVMDNHICAQGGRTNPGQQQAPPPGNRQKNIFRPFLQTNFPSTPNKLEPKLYNGQARQFTTESVAIKAPIDKYRTKFKWTQQNTVTYPLYIKQFTPDVIRHRTFQEKMLWFRLNMEAMRVSWQKGCEVLRVDRGDLTLSSLQGLQTKNLRKQLKIQFDDQKVDDAGGLLREWMHLIIKQIFSENTGIFELCNTDETAYKFKWDKSLVEQYACTFIKLLGIIVGKALFQRISLNCYLNRSIWRQVSGFTVFLHDVYSFDRDLYKAWKSVFDEPGSQNLCLQFYEVKNHTTGQKQQIQLVQGGKNIEVNDANKDQYIFQMIQLHCSRSVKKYINKLIQGITKVVPAQFLSVFEPYQFQMLLNGPQFINIADWKANTLYKGYKHSDQVVVWFWQVIAKCDQKQLGNLLHYCTGSNRVPILGFKYLESNRNTVNKFTIQKVAIHKDNPYPRSYTCFNRLQLPEYRTFNQLQERLMTVIDKEITSFGLD